MNEAQVSRSIITTFAGVDVATDADNTFFFYNPDPTVAPDHRFPFVTLVTSDLYDQLSHLSRSSVFRLNIGVSKRTFHSLFGDPPHASETGGAAIREYDFTALDQVMPHPVYGAMYWVCVLNPSEATFEASVRPLLAEAYGRAVSAYTRRAARA